jgi:nucleotide-binding universal stress UspA family protein
MRHIVTTPTSRDTEGMFTRIVAGYNDSPRARRAFAAAVRMASEGDGVELTAVAVHRGLALSGDSIGEVKDAHASREQACAGWLSAALAYADERGVELRTEIRIGRVAQQLAAAGAAHRADLLIIGRSRAVVSRRQILGTTADQLSRRCNCTIMIVS